MVNIFRKRRKKNAVGEQKFYKVQFGTLKMQLEAEMPSFFAPCGTKVAAKETGKQKNIKRPGIATEEHSKRYQGKGGPHEEKRYSRQSD